MKTFFRDTRTVTQPIIFYVVLLLILALTSCTTSTLKVSEFKFIYDNQSYLIRSAYCSGNPESCNQLIGENLIAVDMNQDRVIDKIDKGDVTLAEAQEIYDYCLNLLEKQNKLSEVNRQSKTYTLSDSDYDYEIKTLYPKMSLPFNEFTIIDKQNNLGFEKQSILVDHDANGTLNELLKGTMSIDNSQKHYAKVVLKGIEDKDLIKKNESIVVN